MTALMLFSLFSLSGKTYQPLLEKSLDETIFVSASINDWKHDEIYNCPMKYETKIFISVSEPELALAK